MMEKKGALIGFIDNFAWNVNSEWTNFIFFPEELTIWNGNRSSSAYSSTGLRATFARMFTRNTEIFMIWLDIFLDDWKQIVCGNSPWMMSVAEGLSLFPRAFSARQTYRPSSDLETFLISKFVPSIRRKLRMKPNQMSQKISHHNPTS